VAFGTIRLAPKQKSAEQRKEKKEELCEIEKEVAERKKEPSVPKKWIAERLDCFLYAQDDNYKKSPLRQVTRYCRADL